MSANIGAGIYTAAMEMLGGGSEVKTQCRKPEIMSDAAYAILTKDSTSYSGHFAIDEEVLRGEGVTDFSQYNYVESKARSWTYLNAIHVMYM